jgi:hypothetical protein
MHSLEVELRELGAVGALDEAAVERAIAVDRRVVFSLFAELRAAAYAAVALVVTGVGILVKEHLDRIGPLTLILLLALAAAACYLPAIRAHARAAARSTSTEYLLLLGALLVSADLGYAESQFHLLGANWSRQLLLLTALHAYTAYALDSRLVLSLALATLAGWFGIERGPGAVAMWSFATPGLGVRALLCAAVMLLWRAIDQRLNAGRSGEVFEHFAANLAFWGVLGWCWDASWRIGGAIAVLVLAAVAIHWALRTRAEAFAAYGVGYAAVGLSLVVAQLTDLRLLGATLVLGIVLVAAAVLRRLHDLLKNAPA